MTADKKAVFLYVQFIILASNAEQHRTGDGIFDGILKKRTSKTQ